MPNPYSSATNLTSRQGIFADSAELVRSGFLYRLIRVDDLVAAASGQFEAGVITYTGWWFWQRIFLNDQRIWSRVSWVSLEREIAFSIPASSQTDSQRHGRIEIDFGPGLRIRRFRLWIEGRIVLDEIG